MLNACSAAKHTKNVDQLIAVLRQGIGDIQAYAVEALGKIKYTRAVDPLIQALKDDNINVLNEAAYGLKKLESGPHAE